MTPADVNRLENGHDTEWADCAIISLGVYLGVPYTDVIRVAARVVEDGGRHGLTRRTLKKIAALFEAPLRVRKTFDPDESYGIVWATKPAETSDHCAVLRNGLVLDRLTVWEWADWLADQRVTAAECVLLVVKE